MSPDPNTQKTKLKLADVANLRHPDLTRRILLRSLWMRIRHSSAIAGWSPTIREWRMPAGRPPKPIHLHRIGGTFRPHRHGARNEPEAPGLINEVQPRSSMGRRQRQIWREVLGDAPLGLLRRIDRQLLVNDVEVVERHERAAIAHRKLDDAARTEPLLSRHGAVVTISPYIRIMNHCVLPMTKLQSEMGFTPSARASLGVPMLPAPEEPGSPHQRFDTIMPDGNSRSLWEMTSATRTIRTPGPKC